MIRNMVSFYGERLSAPPSTPKLEDNLLSAVRDRLFNIFAATLHIWRQFLHPQPEDAPRSGRRDPLITVKGTHLPLWQGPTYRCGQDPLITDRHPLTTVTGTHLPGIPSKPLLQIDLH
jgi:hypothetical protein